MDAKGAGKYRTEKWTVERGTPRRVYGARQRLLRDGHTLAVQTLTEIPATIPEGAQHWAFDVRRGRMTVYGGLLRFLEIMHRKGVPMETALMIPNWLESFIRDVWGDAPEQAAQHVPLKRAA